MSLTVKFEELGTENVLQIIEEEIAKPHGYEVLLDVKSFGINHSEKDFMQGRYIQQPEFPSRIGYEATGIVKDVGKNVSQFKVGDRVNTLPVFNMSKYGVWAQEAIVPEYGLTKAPEYINNEQASACWIAYAAAWGGLVFKGKIKKGDFVLITAAAGSPGLAAIDLANHYGATPIATTRNDSKTKELMKLGAQHVINTAKENLIERVKKITQGHGADIVFDPIAGPGLENLAYASAPFANVVVYGMLDNRPTPFPMFAAFDKGLALHGFTVKDVFENPAVWSQAQTELREGFNDGTLMPVIAKVFELKEVQQAVTFANSKDKIGKVVVKVN